MSRSLAIIVSQFPELHETFVLRELSALARARIPIRIYSLKRCRDRIVHDAARPLLGYTTYAPWFAPSTWLMALRELARAPRCGLAMLGWTLRHHGWPPLDMAKAIVVWGQSLALVSRMRADRVQHIHAHWATFPTTAAVIAARCLGVRFSFTAHAWDIFVRNRSLEAKAAAANQIITCTEYNRQQLAVRCPQARQRIALNYHGVDLTQFKGDTVSTLYRHGQTPVFLSVGRLVQTKGYDTLLQAYHRLVARGVRFRARIVGEGPLQARLRRMIHHLGLASYVEMSPALGQEPLRAVYQQAFALVLPSTVASNQDRDGLPNVILEAMASGLPVVSTTVSGIPEAVESGRTGVLVSPNRPDQLADVLEQLARDPATAQAYGQAARETVARRFNDERHLNQLVNQMKGLLHAEDSPAPRPVPSASVHGPAKVMLVIWSLEIGGAERVVTALAAGLDPARFTPMVVCLNQPGALARELENQHIPVMALHKRPGVDLRLLWQLTRLMRSERPAIVHAHLWGAALWARLAAWLAQVPVVIVHEHGLQPWRRRRHFLLDRWLSCRTARVLFVGQDVMDRYVRRTKIAVAKCQLITNGAAMLPSAPEARQQLRAHYGWSDGHHVMISIGRLSLEKGQADLMDAFALVTRECPSARLVLVGEGSQHRALEQQCERLGLTHRVIFAGAQSDIAGWLAAADLYVQPSLREALSLAVIEAAAAGLPIVATRVGDIERIVGPEADDGLVAPGDPQRLAQVIVSRLADLPSYQAQAATRQQRIRQTYSVEQMVHAVEAVYTQELDRNHPSRLRRPTVQRQSAKMAGRARLALMALLAVALVGALCLDSRDPWIWAYLAEQLRPQEAVATTGPTHIMFLLTDHFEPHDQQTMDRWMQAYPALAQRHHDADGRMPQHTWFWFFSQSDGAESLRFLQQLSRLSYDGYGEVELHLHHDRDTQSSFLEHITRMIRLSNVTGALVTAESTPRTTFGFIHGLWALDNSRHGAACGINNELILLRQLGCYADFTHPSWGPMHPRIVNRLYYATDDPTRPKSYDHGTLMRVAAAATGDLLIFEGPSVVRWRGWRPVYDHGDLTVHDPPTPQRVDAWVRAGVHVRGRPEWIFIKAFTHGAVARDDEAVFGSIAEHLYADFEHRYNDGTRYVLHYVTAREAYNIAKAAEAGLGGNPNQYRDFRIPPYAYRFLTGSAPYELLRFAPEQFTVRWLAAPGQRIEAQVRAPRVNVLGDAREVQTTPAGDRTLVTFTTQDEGVVTFQSTTTAFARTLP